MPLSARPPDQKASELLFPAEDGRFRSESFLKKAFAAVGALVGLVKTFTPRGTRRTFNDLARVANVEALVTKSISGHLTDRMRECYSTVSPEERRRSIGTSSSYSAAPRVGSITAKWAPPMKKGCSWISRTAFFSR